MLYLLQGDVYVCVWVGGGGGVLNKNAQLFVNDTRVLCSELTVKICFSATWNLEPLSRSCLWQNYMYFIKHNLAHISVLNYVLTYQILAFF